MKLWPFQFNFLGKVCRHDKVSARLPRGSRRGRKKYSASKASGRAQNWRIRRARRSARDARSPEACSQARCRHELQILNGTSSCKSSFLCAFPFFMRALNSNFIQGVKRTSNAMVILRETPFRVANRKFDQRQ